MANPGREFMEQTRFQNMDPSDQMMGEEAPPLQWPATPGNKIIHLPEPDDGTAASVSFREVMERRRSIRRYLSAPITLKDLAWFLWASQGVQEIFPGSATLRTVPSAGARHSMETFLLINNVEGLSPGLARYCALEHQLEIVREDIDASHEVTTACLGQEMVLSSAVTFLWAVDIERMTWRYGQRGYRYIFIDAGHACQNLYLAVSSAGCGCCAVAAFDDNRLNQILKLDGKKAFAVYAATVGRIK